MIYVWEEVREGDIKEIIFDLSFDVYQVEKSWEVFLSRENYIQGVRVAGECKVCLGRVKEVLKIVFRI